MENDFAIRVDGLTKKYGSTQNLALNNVDLRIPYGSIFWIIRTQWSWKKFVY